MVLPRYLGAFYHTYEYFQFYFFIFSQGPSIFSIFYFNLHFFFPITLYFFILFFIFCFLFFIFYFLFFIFIFMIQIISH